MPFFLKPCLNLRKKKRKGKISKTMKQVADVTCEVTNTEILRDCMSRSSSISNANNNASNNNNEATLPHASPERDEATKNKPTNPGALMACRSLSIAGYGADKPIDIRMDSDLVVIKAEEAKCELKCQMDSEKEDDISSNISEIDRGCQDDRELMNEVETLLTSLCDLAEENSEDCAIKTMQKEDCAITVGKNEDCAITIGGKEYSSLMPYIDKFEKLEVDSDSTNEIRGASFTIEMESLPPFNLIDTRSIKAIEIINAITVCSNVFEKIEELKALEFFDIPECESPVSMIENVETEPVYIVETCFENENEEPKILAKSALEGDNNNRNEDVSNLETESKHNVNLKEYFGSDASEHEDYENENEHANPLICEKMHKEQKEKDTRDLETEKKPNVELKEHFNTAESEHGICNKESQDTNSLNRHEEQKTKDISDFENMHKRIICDLKNENETKSLREIVCDSIFDKEKKVVDVPTRGNGDTKQNMENGEQNSFFSKLNTTVKHCDLEITKNKEYDNNERQTSTSCDVNKNEADNAKKTTNPVDQGSLGEGGDTKIYTIYTESSKMGCNIFNNSQHTNNGSFSTVTLNTPEEVGDIACSEYFVNDQHENKDSEEDSINMTKDTPNEISDETTNFKYSTPSEFDDTTIESEDKSNICEDSNSIKTSKCMHHDEMSFIDKEYSEKGISNESFDSKDEDDTNLEIQHCKENSVVAEEVCSDINDQPNDKSGDILIKHFDNNENSNEIKNNEFSSINELQILGGITQDTNSELGVNQESKTNSVVNDHSNITCFSGSNQDFLGTTLNSTSDAQNSGCEKDWHYNFKEKKQPSDIEGSIDLSSFKWGKEMDPKEKHNLESESLLNIPIISTENDFSSCSTKEALEQLDSNEGSVCFETCSSWVNSDIVQIKLRDKEPISENILNRDKDLLLDDEICNFNNDASADDIETCDSTGKNDFSFNIEEMFQKQCLGDNSVSAHVPNLTNDKSRSNENIQCNIGDCAHTRIPNTIDNDSINEFPMDTFDEKLMNMENMKHLPFKTIPAHPKNFKEDPFLNQCTNNYYENNKDSDEDHSGDSDDNDSDDSDDSDSDDGEFKNSIVEEVNDYNSSKGFEVMKHDKNGNKNLNDKDYIEIPDQTESFSSPSNLDSIFSGKSTSKNTNHGLFNSSLIEKSSFDKQSSISCKQKMNDCEKNSNARNFMETLLVESPGINSSYYRGEICDPFNTTMYNRSLERIDSKKFDESSWKASPSFEITTKCDKSINKYSVSSPSDSSDSSDKSENGEPNDYLKSKGSKCFVVSACGDSKNLYSSIDTAVPTKDNSFEVPTENLETAEYLQTPSIAESTNNPNASKKLSGSGNAVESKYKIHITNKTKPKLEGKIAKINQILNSKKTGLMTHNKFSDFLKKGQFEKIPFPAHPHKNDNRSHDNCRSILSKIENIFTEIEKQSKLHDLDEIEVCRRQFINKYLSKKKQIFSEMSQNIRDVPIKNSFIVQSQFRKGSKNAAGKGKNVGKSQFSRKTRESGNRINDYYKTRKNRNSKPRDKMDKKSPKIHNNKCQNKSSNHKKLSSDTDSEILTDQSAKMTPDRKRILDASRDIRSPKLPFKINKKSLHHAALYRQRPVKLRPSKMNLVAFLTNNGDDSYQIKRGYRLHNPDTSISRTATRDPENQESSRDGNYRCWTNRATSPDALRLKFDDLFRKYASRGRPNGELISYKRSTEWLKDAGVVGKNITTEEANDVFKCIAGVKVALNKGDYRNFLQKLTRLKRLNYFEIYERLCSATNGRQD